MKNVTQNKKIQYGLNVIIVGIGILFNQLKLLVHLEIKSIMLVIICTKR